MAKTVCNLYMPESVAYKITDINNPYQAFFAPVNHDFKENTNYVKYMNYPCATFL